MPKIVMTRGIPGSGKSTFAKEWLAESPETRVRVNRDGIRWTQGIRQGNGSKEQEETVTLIEKAIVTAALAEGKDVIIDSMNLNPQFTKAWFKLGYPVEFVDFPTPLDVCIERDAARNRTVGEAIVRKIAKRYKVGEDGRLPAPPTWTPKPKPDLTPAAEWDDNLPTAWIVDTDGTLANHEGVRGPYDTSRYHLDAVHEDVARLVALLGAEHYIIGVSGRDAEFALVTMEWWRSEARITPDYMHFRPRGDGRPDDVVKAEIYEEHIRGKFNVVGVLDDRGRVLRMWRAKGLTTFAVGDTDNYNF